MRKNMIFLPFLLMLIPVYFNGHQTRQEIVQALFRSVEKWMGTRYVLGGETKTGIDCSAFVMVVYKEVFNMNIPRRVRDQAKLGTIVKDKLQPGDLMFFKIDDSISHIGIYVFDNKFIHAASSGPQTGVIKSSLDQKYYKERYVYARRIIELPPFKNNNGKITVKKENKYPQNTEKNEVIIDKKIISVK